MGYRNHLLLADLHQKGHDWDEAATRLEMARGLMQGYAQRPQEELRWEAIDFWNWIVTQDGVTISQRMMAQYRKEQLLGFRRMPRPVERAMETPSDVPPDGLMPIDDEAEQARIFNKYHATDDFDYSDLNDWHIAEACRQGRSMSEVAAWARREKVNGGPDDVVYWSGTD